MWCVFPLCLQRSQDMQRAGTSRSQAPHSCSLSWVWAAVSPHLSPMVCDWNTQQTAVITGLSSPRSVCPQPSAALVILRVQSIPRLSTNTGRGSPSTCPVLPSSCFWTSIPKICRYFLKVHKLLKPFFIITCYWTPQFPQNSLPLDPDPLHPRCRRMGSR